MANSQQTLSKSSVSNSSFDRTRSAKGRANDDARPQLARTHGGERESLLGTYAKTASAPNLTWADTGDGTGEIVPFARLGGTDLKPFKDPQSVRAERFALKSVVNRLLPQSKTAKCMRWRIPKQHLQVLKSKRHNKAFYSGLEVCARVWTCPVCCAKVSERRRMELISATAAAQALGWQVQLATLTVPHGLGDNLDQMLDMMMVAWRKCSSTRSAAKWRQCIGLEGTVRALEVTDGLNGFHPHFHVLLFINSPVTTADVQQGLAPLWQDACVKAGLPRPSDAHGVRVDDGSYAAKYASKWGLESEMTKGHSKTGKKDSLTPFDLLRRVLSLKCERSALRFQIYAEAFAGRRQLYWSNGLRAKLGLNAAEKTDEELAHEQEEPAGQVAELTDDQWRAILRTKSEAAVLNVAETNPDHFHAFLEGVVAMAKAMPPPPRRKRRYAS